MRKHYSYLILILFIFSCKDKSNLVEVQLPEPEETVSVSFGNPNDVKAKGKSFEMVPLKYAYDALKPAIDGKTMELHYSKHYLGYTSLLNKQVDGNKQWEGKTIEEVLAKVGPEEMILKNNAGGYYNHSLFFEILKPKGAKSPSGEILEAINASYSSFSNFKTKFLAEGNNHFGSGWVWLIVTKNKELKIVTTSNQDNPLMNDAKSKGIPILGIDLWEHAYYLQYQNNRNEYLETIFDSVNWTVVSKKYTVALENLIKQPISVSPVKKEILVNATVISTEPKKTEPVKETKE
ncbi:superoxide dismutase [Flavobacterium sp. NRK F7]|uniref:superoxide dismutase n=1 Tax=Flavobacterium sp. NRK F7 TaxID=2954930 RepID=UPI0020913E48|nr:superoxide dismutase [Flavobacterium sp. NRK F7]MCO6162682.1 superoxide dismutase [Flavobacterium sp. NRK F7]